MATRKRRPVEKKSSDQRRASRFRLRRSLLEKLEARQLLAAGPQLIGIQPNQGSLIDAGMDPVTQLNVAPRVLTFRFDDGQQIHPDTLDAIRLTRAGNDGQLDTLDDVLIEPGSVLVNSQAENEVLVRFAESLPDDRYRIEVFAFDDPSSGIVGLRNTADDGTAGVLLQPRDSSQRKELREFELRLGALVESVVPQPVVRLGDGTLQQQRDQVTVYFNEPLFLEDVPGTAATDPTTGEVIPGTGVPTDRSAHNPRFYQLLYTQDSVRNTDDFLFLPTTVEFNNATQTATLTFAKDLELLIRENVMDGVGGGAYRLRVGNAVNLPAGVDGTQGVPTYISGDLANSIDLFFEPDSSQNFVSSARSTLRTTGEQTTTVEFISVAGGVGAKWNQVRFVDSGVGGLAVTVNETDNYFDLVVDLGGANPRPSVQALVDLINDSDVTVNDGASLRVEAMIVSGSGDSPLGAGLPAMDPIRLLADSFSTAYDVGMFGGSQVTSLIFDETISPVPYTIDLPGGPNDPAARDLLGRNAGVFADYINSMFSPESDSQIKLIEYNFGPPAAGLGNSITDEMKQRVREALDLWSNYLGVRFVETNSDGLAIALGTPTAVNGANVLLFNQSRAAVVPDAAFEDGLLVLDALHQWQVGFGQDFFRTAFAGVGALLGLGQANDLGNSTVMALSDAFLNGTINQNLFNTGDFDRPIYNQVGAEFSNRPLEPIFPGNYDIQHGSFLHGQVGSDLDLYRFEVDVTTGSNTGILTAETFAQRLPDSSPLDTSLRLFQETQAAVETSFSIPVAPIRIEAIAPGKLGNQTKIDFVRSFRDYSPPDSSLTAAEDAQRKLDNQAEFRVIIVQTGINSFTVDIPFLPNLDLLDEADQASELDDLARTPRDMLKAIQADPFASSLVRVIDVHGDDFGLLDNFAEFEPIFNLPELPFKQLVLSGGDIEPIAFNDNYFGTDSRLQLPLGDGVYYIGVSASGNDQYDPVIPGTGFGGGSEGDYQLFVKFEANTDGRDSLRDVDGDAVGIPGTPVDGDGDGIPGGANNFWFQVRPEARQVAFANGSTVVPGSTMTLVAGPTGITRTYQFVQVDAFNNVVPGQPPLSSGNIAIRYRTSFSSSQMANLVASLVNAQSGSTQVTAAVGVGADIDNLLTFSNERSVSFSPNFRGATVYGRTIFVDKSASAFPDGTSAQPFNNIASAVAPSAFRVTHPGDIVRIVGNGGNDGLLETPVDNFAYSIGFGETGGAILEDGASMDVPLGVTVMIDAGTIVKLRNARIGVGSSNLQLDRSGSALQVLGTPRLLNAAGELMLRGEEPAVGSVIFTSSRDRTVAQATPGTTLPGQGDWGGIVLRRDVDDEFGRFNLEDQGIFLNHINFADIRYGGGSNVRVDATQVTVNPIQIVDTRPTITFNRITDSADAAMSAAPNSFEEVSYQAPRYQAPGAFTSDYDRVGPDIRRNVLTNNSLNGLFIRVETQPDQDPVQQVVSGRWDDTDIVHILSENLILAGNAGGAIRDGFRPSLSSVTHQVISDAGSVEPGTYSYRLTLVDMFGFESLASDATPEFTVAGDDSQIRLSGLPQVPASSDYRFRRLYRSDDGVNYGLVAELNANATGHVDRLAQADATSMLDLARTGERGRPTSSLVIDPGTVVKIQGSRIEVGFGAQLLAEGTESEEVIFSSIQDDRFGAGGSFDTNNNGTPTTGFSAPAAGDWAGFYASPTSHLSLDHAVVAYAGGLSRIEGTFKAFNPIELQQATARIVNTIFEDNADGIGGQGPNGRFGRLANTPATIFVRGSQPIIVGNSFTGNEGSVIDIDANSLLGEFNLDVGRQTGYAERLEGLDDNRGPLVRRNALDNNELNGMEIRGNTLTTESVWDDTDIVHVLYDSIVVDNFHGSGQLRLQSSPNESLVIKLLGAGSPFSDTTGTGFTVTGTENGIADRIGGAVHVLGRPGFPVVMTSLYDDTVGAGRKPDGTEQTDTNNDRFATRPSPNDWRSLFLDQTSNDRNVAVVQELELQTDQAPGSNGRASSAQVLGDLAGRIVQGDDLRRIGFEVEGFLSQPSDVDVYQFRGEAGSEIWIDIDRTSFALDSVVELLDAQGRVLARSTNSGNEVFDSGTIEVFSEQVDGLVGPLSKGPLGLATLSSGDEYFDFGSTNPRDAGMRIVLPGAVGSRGPYFVRVRSNSVDINDAAGGLTSGSYRFQIRLGERQEFPGSTVTFADIRFANHGVHVKGLPGESPLLGEAQENEGVSAVSNNNSIFQDAFASGNRPQYLGNLLAGNDRTVSVGGALSGVGDVDFYRVVLDAPAVGSTAGGVIAPAVFDIDYADGISRPDTNMAIYYSASGSPATAQLVLYGSASNIAEDRTGFLSTLSENIFHAGSTGSGDPFIGPVALPEGTYFVGISHGARQPTVLGNTSSVRREPINSVVRIAEERFYSGADTPVLTTAEAPVVAELFDTQALPAGWELDVSRGGNPGHGIPASFDGSRPATAGGRSLRFNPSTSAANTVSTFDSATFSLAGYSAEDLPRLYFNYFFSGGAGDRVRLEMVAGNQVTTIASNTGQDAVIDNNGGWQQAIVPLDAFEFRDSLILRLVYETGNTTFGEGFYIDDIVIGFAERGEMVMGATPGDDSFTASGEPVGISSGEYQLEVRPATSYFRTSSAPGRQIVLDEAFDTNDRHAESITIVAPAGADLQDGFRFNLGDGSKALTFEFDELTVATPNGNGVAFGNIRIPFRSVDTPEKVGASMRAAINAAVDQNGLRIKASTAFGGIVTTPSDERINLYGPVTGDFVSIEESMAPTPVVTTNPLHVRIPARFSKGLGDINAERAQGQVIIDSNTISDAKVYGIWSDPGDRLIDPLDDSGNVYHENFGLHSPALGAVRNLPTTNDDVIGGLAPGLVIQNNVIDRAGYVGIQIQGDQRPIVIDSVFSDNVDPELENFTDAGHLYFGALIFDGHTFAIDAGGTRVVFEFEDISGTDEAPDTIHSGDVQPGGRGWTPGHVPVYYRSGGPGANPYNPPTPTQRVYASTKTEVMHAMRDAIIGSILVTNDLVPLVDVWVNDSMAAQQFPSDIEFFGGDLADPLSALYIRGASGIHWTTTYNTARVWSDPAFPFNGFPDSNQAGYAAPVQEAVQPFARVINNTVYGSDGTAANFAQAGALEPSDQLATAIDTKQGRSHSVGAYTTTGVIGDANLPIASQDVDLYRFHLDVGDRVQIDLSTLDAGPDVALRLFNSDGEVQMFPGGPNGELVDVINSGDAPGAASIDFTALASDAYFLGVSSTGNEAYNALSFADRVDGSGGTGAYDLSLEVLAPRQHVLSLQEVTQFQNLPGTTFTIEQVADLPGQPGVNEVTFEFVAGGGVAPLANGNIPVNIITSTDHTGWRTSDVMRAIASAINRTINGRPVLPNHASGNGPEGLSGPIGRVEAVALGGVDGWDGNSGLSVYNGGTVNGVTYPLRPHVFGPGAIDAPSGFGHNRIGQVNSVGIGGSDGAGTSENYVLIHNAVRVTVNNVPNLAVDPQPGTNMDQLLPEVGVMARNGASPSLMNNVIVNTQAAVESEVTKRAGFGSQRGPDIHPKPGQVIVGGTIFQHTEDEPAIFQTRMTWPGPGGAGTETDSPNFPSNINPAGSGSDFNLLLAGTQPLFVDPSNHNFVPVPGSIAIDSSINSLAERDAYGSLKQALGLPVNPLLAPSRDVTGQLRVDDPEVSFTGLGSNVFKDRGAHDRADFVGPVAVAITPFDNDAFGNDSDPNVSVVQVQDGVISEFRIQLRDSGDASDPFQGSGVDDSSVFGPTIAGVRRAGAAITLFENGRLLEEGIDYLFSYDSTNDVITLRPLAGIWRQTAVYEIGLNNRDRFVVTAPAGPQVTDGDQFQIYDDQGGLVTFEYEAGHQLQVPEVITLAIPAAGTGSGGIADGDRVTINDGINTVTFEFTTELGSVLSGNIPVLFAVGDTPQELVVSLEAAIQSKIDDETLTQNIPGVGVRSTVTLQVDGQDKLRIGMESGGIVNASSSGLVQASRTIALQVPLGGVGQNGVADGDVFVVTDGINTFNFEFDNDGDVAGANVAVDIAGVTQPDDVVRAIDTALASTILGVTTRTIGSDLLYLGLPEGGNALIASGRLAVVSLAQTMGDGGTITLTPEGGQPVVLELNRMDEVSGNDGVTLPNLAINFTRTSSGNEIASQIVNAIANDPTLNLRPTAPGSGVISVGGDASLVVLIDNEINLSRTAEPGVTANSTLRIFGPLLLESPLGGGNSTPDGSTFSITANGVTEQFAFNEANTPVDVPTAVQIDYLRQDTADDLAARIVASINGSGLGITATALPNGQISLGQLPDGSVALENSTLTSRRGVVSDGETVIITEEGQQLVFEFEDANGGGGVAPGAIQVLFNSTDTTDQVAESFAAAIRIAGAQLGISAENIGNGEVELVDTPRTRVDISAAPTLSLSGVSGGAVPVLFVEAASFSSVDLKLAIIEAINTANERFGTFVTSLTAVDRGGDTFFVENAISVEQPLVSYFMPAIKDVTGNELKPNRSDGTTRFTLLLPTVDFDYGDAPDPQALITGRYPTLASSDGARHILGDGPLLGSRVDAEVDGQPLIGALGDDAAAYVVGAPSASLMYERLPSGLKITVDASVADGDLIRIANAAGSRTFELDSDNIFAEDHLPVRFVAGDSPETIAQRLREAIAASPLGVADVDVMDATVTVITNDDDGVSFTSATNPFGVFNPNIETAITVTVTGSGFVDGWVDFNADGDWDDPGEKIFTNLFFDGVNPIKTIMVPMPPSAPTPNRVLETYARFRVSSNGNLNPSGLAIDGEVEDYQVRIVPGSPPVINNPSLTYNVDEDQRLLGNDPQGTNNADPNDNGLLAGIVDPDGDTVEVFPAAGEEVINGVPFQIVGLGSNQIFSNGVATGDDAGELAGVLNVNANGTFTFDPVPDYFGDAVFRVRVQDRQASGDAELELVAPQLLTVTVAVAPINDPPVLSDPAVNTINIDDSPEDQVVTLVNADLVALFNAGPDNEDGQALRVQTAGFGGVANVTKLGGSLQVAANGDVIYTPPTDFSGPGTDEFVFNVVDAPAAGQAPQSSTQQATIVVSFVAVNDPPTAGPDFYNGQEDQQLEIALTGANGILGNDFAGPQDEIDAGQTVSLVADQFPLTTVRGGTVALSADGLTLIYTPRDDFAGTDTFQYQITDNAGAEAATAFGTVTIDVQGVNDGAVFGGPDTLTYNESKGSAQSFDIDLNTWFTDPEGDALTFQATSANDLLLVTSLGANGILTITLPEDASGETVLTVTAFNPGNTLASSADIDVTVVNTPDPPRERDNVSLDPINTNEDVNVIRDLGDFFFDPDGDVLTYSLVTPAGENSPFDPSLIAGVTFTGDQMEIRLVPNAFGSSNLTLRVSDGTFAITKTFTLNVASQPDVPVSVEDRYQVPVRGRLTISDPRSGLLANDSEADGDDFTVLAGSINGPQNGTVSVNPNGTFTYTNISNSNVGQTDTFSYQAVDENGGIGNRVTVTIELIGSTHQNPVNNLDVNADGSVSPIDALRIINLLNRSPQSAIPIRDLPAPPDFFDTNGNGLVVPMDALAIINFLNRNPNSSGGEGEGFDLRLATGTNWVSAGTANLPQSNLVRPETADDLGTAESDAFGHDASSWQIVDGHLEGAIDSLVTIGPAENEESKARATDDALADLLADFDLGLLDE
ncbi:Ig-like domain-containing protein [Planctomycetaceae bacterium SH139]